MRKTDQCLLVRHIQVDDGQHHEDKGLQRDDQDVEDGPSKLQHATVRLNKMLVAVQERDQDEDHLARIHVSEQTQGKRDWLGQRLMPSRSRFAGMPHLPNGCSVSSPRKPPTPFILKL